MAHGLDQNQGQIVGKIMAKHGLDENGFPNYIVKAFEITLKMRLTLS